MAGLPKKQPNYSWVEKSGFIAGALSKRKKRLTGALLDYKDFYDQVQTMY
jgi:hypothetical protein